MTTPRSTSRAPWRASVLLASLALIHCSAPSKEARPDRPPLKQAEREESKPASISSEAGGGAASDAEAHEDAEFNLKRSARDRVAPSPNSRGAGPVDFSEQAPVERPAEVLSRDEPADEGFEGDTFEEDPSDLIKSLEKEIGLQIDEYREEFGVEDFTAPSPDSCDKVCDLSDAICRSSTRICAISGDNPAESWFADRCQWSAKECRRSGDQCESCTR